MSENINNLNNGSLIKILSSDDNTKKLNDGSFRYYSIKLSNFIIRNKVKIYKILALIAITALLYCFFRYIINQSKTSTKLLNNVNFIEILKLIPEDKHLELEKLINNNNINLENNTYKLLTSPKFIKILNLIREDKPEEVIKFFLTKKCENIVNLLLSDSYYTLILLPKNNELFTNLFNRNEDIKKNISNLLINDDFNKTLNYIEKNDSQELFRKLFNKKDDIQKNISKLLGDEYFNKTLRSLPKDKCLELINDLIDRNVDINEGVCRLLTYPNSNANLCKREENDIFPIIYNLLNIKNDIKDNILSLLYCHHINEILFSNPDKLNSFINKTDDIPKNINNLLRYSTFSKTLEKSQNGLALLELFINKDSDITDSILDLLCTSYFNYILQSLEKENQLEIFTLLINDKGKNIQNEIFELFRGYNNNFAQNLAFLKDDGVEIIKFLINKKDGIEDDCYNKLLNIDKIINRKNDANRSKIIEEIYNTLEIPKGKIYNKIIININSQINLNNVSIKNNNKNLEM